MFTIIVEICRFFTKFFIVSRQLWHSHSIVGTQGEADSIWKPSSPTDEMLLGPEFGPAAEVPDLEVDPQSLAVSWSWPSLLDETLHPPAGQYQSGSMWRCWTLACSSRHDVQSMQPSQIHPAFPCYLSASSQWLRKSCITRERRSHLAWRSLWISSIFWFKSCANHVASMAIRMAAAVDLSTVVRILILFSPVVWQGLVSFFRSSRSWTFSSLSFLWRTATGPGCPDHSGYAASNRVPPRSPPPSWRLVDRIAMLKTMIRNYFFLSVVHI